MMGVCLQGIVLGLMIALIPGPIFFSLIQTGIYRGFRQGVLMAIGVIISDAILISICYLGVSSIIDQLSNRLMISSVGGIVLIVFGTVTFFRKPQALQRLNPGKHPKAPGLLTYVGKGFLLNLSNPFIIIFWLTSMSWLTSNADPDRFHISVMAFFSCTLVTVFATDLMKCYVGYKIKYYMRPRVMLWINRVVGIVLAASGAFLILHMIYEHLIKLQVNLQ